MPKDKKNVAPGPEATTNAKSETETVRHIPDKWSLLIVGSYALIMLGIGLPLWWKTTTVYRVPLPYDEMLTLNQHLEQNFKISIKVQLKGFTLKPGDRDEVGLEIGEKIDDLHHTFEFDYETKMDGDEMDVLYKSLTLEEIDFALCEKSRKSSFDFTIYYLGREDLHKEYGLQMIVGNCKNIYYISNDSKIQSLEPILKFLRQFINYEKTETEMVLPLASGYNIIFSLIVPEPDKIDARWNIEEGIEKYIDPMLEKLSSFAEFSVRSQYLYYTKLNLNPRYNAKSGVFDIPYAQLPLVINPVESKLNSYVSQNPVLNFLLYVTPCNYAPAQLLDENGDILESNAFFVPQWGGIQIYNGPCPNEKTNATNLHEIFIPKIIGTFISQFRELIGTPELKPGTVLIKQFGSVFRDWEIEMMLRRRLHRLLFTSSNTLKSLRNLLDHITNIVVREEVGDHVKLSVDSLKKAFEEAKVGNIRTAQEYAITAYKSSESAFHHPSNLAQLYFPDDQKYAIYIPLFLPVGIPVLLSMRSLIQYFRNTK